jgi:hypothetical protein
MNKNKNTTLPFILVSDSTIAEKLKQLGLELIIQNESIYTFANNNKLVFSDDIDEHKIVYSNKLCI